MATTPTNPSNNPGWQQKPAKVEPTLRLREKAGVNLTKFDQLVEAQGIWANVYRTTYCPNVKSVTSGEHEIDCPLCNGAQFIDRHPIKCQLILSGFSDTPQPFSEGIYDGNTVTATFARGIELQYFTLVEILDLDDVYIQRVKRQEGNIDIMKYSALQVNLIIDQHSRMYYEGTDYNIDPNGNIKWLAGQGPVPGTIYSINYNTAIRFRATKAIHKNRFVNITGPKGDTMTKMFEQWILEKAYLVDRKDQFNQYINAPKNNSSDPTEEEDYLLVPSGGTAAPTKL